MEMWGDRSTRDIAHSSCLDKIFHFKIPFHRPAIIAGSFFLTNNKNNDIIYIENEKERVLEKELW